MSEDDTFRILARPSFDEIRGMHANHRSEYHKKHGNYPTTENISFMKHYGWSWVEYLREQRSRRLKV